jgi:3-oxoacyl-[acyl-carrier-protein] synthase III
MKKFKNARILGTGSYLPEKRLSNHDLSKIVETDDEWIFTRSGIRNRHIASDGELTSDMALKAALNALEAANIKPQELGGIIVATTTPDLTFPSTAAILQAKLGIDTQCMAFDVQAVCSGFVYALAVANGFFKSGMEKPILVVGAEKMSAILNWDDRTTCVLFGDGAGAVILGATVDEMDGIISTHLHADGRHCDLLRTSGGVTSTGEIGKLTMEGKEVFKFAVDAMAGAVREALIDNNLTANDIDWLVPHQANIRIIEATAKKLDMPMNKVVVTLENQGNTSAASIPLALDHAVRNGNIKRGQTILLEAMGGGFTWGAALIRY